MRALRKRREDLGLLALIVAPQRQGLFVDCCVTLCFPCFELDKQKISVAKQEIKEARRGRGGGRGERGRRETNGVSPNVEKSQHLNNVNST